VGRGGLSVYSSSRRGLLEAGYMIFRVIETDLMPRLVGGDAERVCSKLKKGNRFLKPNFEVGPSFSTHAALSNLFNLGRHKAGAQHYCDLRISAFAEWSRAVA
jgi:hypothetical protein